jgi:hypothetical protein
MKYLVAFTPRQCARCFEPIDTAPVFQDDEWYHHACWEEGVRQLQHATEVSRQLVREFPRVPTENLAAQQAAGKLTRRD